MNNLKTSLSFPCQGHNIIIGYFSIYHIILNLFIFTARNEVAIFFLSAQEYKNAICKNSLKENRTFIFAYLITHPGNGQLVRCRSTIENQFDLSRRTS